MLRTILLSAVVLLLCGSVSRADLVLGLKWTDGIGNAPGAIRSINNGDTLSVDMFLLDTDGSTLLSNEGLLTAGGALFQTGSSTDLSSTVTPAGFTPNPGLDSADPADPFDSPDFGRQTDPLEGVPLNGRQGLIGGFTYFSLLSPLGITSTNVHLASYALTFNGADGETGSINTDVFDSSGAFQANITENTFQELDTILTDFATTPGNFGSLSFALNGAAVPEASTCLVGGLLLGGWYVARRRRRQSPPVV